MVWSLILHVSWRSTSRVQVHLSVPKHRCSRNWMSIKAASILSEAVGNSWNFEHRYIKNNLQKSLRLALTKLFFITFNLSFESWFLVWFCVPLKTQFRKSWSNAGGFVSTLTQTSRTTLVCHAMLTNVKDWSSAFDVLVVYRLALFCFLSCAFLFCFWLFSMRMTRMRKKMLRKSLNNSNACQTKSSDPVSAFSQMSWVSKIT